MISCAQMCLVFVKGYSFYNFFFDSWGASPPDPPLSLAKQFLFVEHQYQNSGEKKETHREI